MLKKQIDWKLFDGKGIMSWKVKQPGMARMMMMMMKQKCKKIRLPKNKKSLNLNPLIFKFSHLLKLKLESAPLKKLTIERNRFEHLP